MRPIICTWLHLLPKVPFHIKHPASFQPSSFAELKQIFYTGRVTLPFHTMESPEPELDHIKKVWKRMWGNSPIYDFLLGSNQDLTFKSASKGSFTAHLRLSAEHVNSRKTIHGSVIATIVDWAGGLAIATHGLEQTGLSLDIHVTYISTAQVGDTIEIEGIANKVGRSIGFTSVKLTKLVDGEQGPIVATASHTKYIRQ